MYRRAISNRSPDRGASLLEILIVLLVLGAVAALGSTGLAGAFRHDCIYTQPPGASVFVDGSELGITPYKRPAFAGKHKLVLGHIGYRSEQRETEVIEAKPTHVEVTLVLGSEPTAVAVEKTPVYKKWSFKE